MFSSSDNIRISVMSLSSVEIHLLAQLTVDFTVLQIFLQVTDNFQALYGNLKYFLRLEWDRYCLLKLALLGNKINSASCEKYYTVFQTKLRG